jgi:hypothetical protein
VLEGISLLSGHHRATTVRRFAGGLITNCPDAFKSGDEAYSGLLDFGEKYHVTSAHVTAIGALSRWFWAGSILKRKCIARTRSMSRSRWRRTSLFVKWISVAQCSRRT